MEERCWCIIDRVQSNCAVRLVPLGNFRQEDNCVIFPQDDPNFAVEVFDAGEVETLIIEGRCARLTGAEMPEQVRAVREKAPARLAKLSAKRRPAGAEGACAAYAQNPAGRHQKSAEEGETGSL